VYQKILEFYNAALEILTRKGAKLVLRLVLENDRLPNIVKDFLACADTLKFIIQKATIDILDDIRNVLYAQDSKSLFIGSLYISLIGNQYLDGSKLRSSASKVNSSVNGGGVEPIRLVNSYWKVPVSINGIILPSLSSW
jgi:hypothetical protein